jgi:hypothetical protein
VLAVLKSREFRRDYHRALDDVDKSPVVHQLTARRIIESYFKLEKISPNTPLKSGSIYFTERPVKTKGTYKYLVPGHLKGEWMAGPLFLLEPKPASVERSLDAKEFDGAVSAVVAVRLTLKPERVNGIISFIVDAKKFYANNDVASAERALGTALDHLNRAAAEGLQRIKIDAEKGKRSNEVAGTRRTLGDLRRKLQTERIGRAKRRSSDEQLLST